MSILPVSSPARRFCPVANRARWLRVSLVGTCVAVIAILPVQPVWSQPLPRAAATAKVDNPATSVSPGVQALETAHHLDELAQQSRSVAESRSRWLEASKVLDQYLAQDPSAADAITMQVQAAVYLWARCRASLDRVELLAPTVSERVEVAQGLDDVIARFRSIMPKAGGSTELFSQNVRFRLAQALADRALLRSPTDPALLPSIKEAQGLLDRSINSPKLRGFARLLHAELANRLGQYGPAQIEAEEAAKLDPPPAALATAEVRIHALIGRGLASEASAAIEQAAVSSDQKTLWRLRLALSRRQVNQVGQSLLRDEREVFDLANQFRGGYSPPARRGLMELARAIEKPATTAVPEWWDLLAEGHLHLLEPAQAANLASQGADRARETDPAQAAALRFKAGACWFEAEKFAEAETSLSQVFQDSLAPSAVRARAGMLRAVSRGQALATHRPGASKATYLAALEDQLRAWPDDPASDEARWLLGKIRLASNRPEEAIALWSRMEHRHPHWVEATNAAADLAINAVEEQWISHDLGPTRLKVETARALIRRALDQASEGEESIALSLRLARLESIPGVGQPAEAVTVLDQVLRGAGNPDQHRQARLGRMVALAELNRFAEAESVARNEAKLDDFAPLSTPIRTLDQLASITESDLIRKRSAALIRLLVDRWVEPIDRTPPDSRDEVRLRQVRALAFQGETVAARNSLARWGGPNQGTSDTRFLQDLGDTYLRLDAFALAVDVERLRASKLATGGVGWFDARYSLALALYRSERGKDARKIIDATMLLHPNLGGGAIRAKFERLRQKLNAEPG